MYAVIIMYYIDKEISSLFIFNYMKEKYNWAYHDEEHTHFSLVSILCCDSNALLIGSFTLHLSPQVCVQEDAITPRYTHDWNSNEHTYF